MFPLDSHYPLRKSLGVDEGRESRLEKGGRPVVKKTAYAGTSPGSSSGSFVRRTSGEEEPDDVKKRAMTRRVAHKLRTNARQWWRTGADQPDGVVAVASSRPDETGWHRTDPDRNRFAVNRTVHGSSPCSGASFEFRFVRISSAQSSLPSPRFRNHPGGSSPPGCGAEQSARPPRRRTTELAASPAAALGSAAGRARHQPQGGESRTDHQGARMRLPTLPTRWEGRNTLVHMQPTETGALLVDGQDRPGSDVAQAGEPNWEGE